MLRTLALLATAVALACPDAALAARKAKGTKKAVAAKAVTGAADELYGAAKAAHASLKKDARRRKYREGWLAVAEKFLAVADKYPKSPRAPEALYNAGNLFSDLSRISLAKKDLDRALKAYQRLADSYPKSNLADDAHYALALIYRDRRGDPAAAASELKQAVALKGDMRRQASDALAALGDVQPAKKEPAAPKKSSKGAERPLLAAFEAASRDEERAAERPEPASEPMAAATLPAVAEKPAVAAEPDEEGEAQDHPSVPLGEMLDPQKLRALRDAAKADVPLSIQVGLKVRRVVIDPGHGGYDTGAIGPAGTREKDVALAIARLLRANLEKKGLEVVLTRDDDRFVSLEERGRHANSHRGDLFVSIHCNAHKSRKLRGTETYVLNVTNDRYAMRLAARENASSERTLSDLQLVLADVATRANTGESRKLAKAVQSEMLAAQAGGKRPPRNLGVKQALFYVLLGAKMPSVLVETAFITNPQDEKLLASEEGQQAFADALAEGVARFVAEREALAAADW